MTNIIKSISATTILLALLATSAAAQDSRAGRYTMHKADDGFVRLDTESGAVSLCQKHSEGWRCEEMPGTADRTIIEKLKSENADLKQEVARLEEMLGLRGDGKDRGPAFRLPTEKEVDNALDYFERMLKKFQDRLKRLEEKSEQPERQL
ncbi:MAG: hypothetical protein KKB37_06525 [Alphaproteobacteria bacterium]|nr:hypothetical protein [Alphaproteobacteria bacterium]